MFAGTRCGQLNIRMPLLLLALVCVWMSGIAQLHHTDDLSEFRSFQPTHNQQLTRAITSTTPDTCAACEWDQMLGQAHMSKIVVVYFGLATIDITAEAKSRALVEAFETYSDRGPPAFIS